MKPLLVAAVCLALLASGCTRPDNVSVGRHPTTLLDPAWAEKILNPPAGHDHAKMADHHNLTTPNFQTLGWDPMVGSSGTSDYYFPCGDARTTTDGRRLAIIESDGDILFALADVTVPTDPVYLGELIMKTTNEYDVALAPDGKHVLVVTQIPKSPDGSPQAPLLHPLLWQSACDPTPRALTLGPGDDVIPRPNSLLLVDISNLENPQVVDNYPLPGIGHSVSSEVIDGRTFVALAVYAETNFLSSYQFYEIVTTPLGPRLSYLSTFNMPPESNVADMTGSLGHDDVWLVKHPKTGKLMAWMAHWDHGLIIVDLSDPRMPKQVGHWSAFDPARAEATGGMHSLYVAPDLWNGHHYVVTGPELGSHPSDQPTGTVWVLDTTDPSKPHAVAGWTLPLDVQWTKGGEWSGHYLTVVNRTAFITMYHGGIWAIDLSHLTASFQSLPSVGVYVPDRESPAPPTRSTHPSPWAPMLGEVHAFEDGTMVTFEASSGLYSFKFNDAEPMPPPTPWPIKAPIGI